VPSHADLALRIFIAMVLGGAIGLERELKDKSAGLRTHISVALGCALFGMISAYSWQHFGKIPRNDSSYQVDVTRIASTMVTGIGFLGGGAILKHGASVRGLTTAGSLWVTAAIGLGVGLGEYFISTITTVALLVALVVVQSVASGRHYDVDAARLAGVAAGAVAVWRRLPFLVVLVIAAITAAGLRQV
jgi:putative Mg2+ transporter-C (MgtC) family protein